MGDVGVVHDCKRGNFHGESSGLVPFLSLLFLNRSLVSFEYLMVNNKLGVVGYKNVGFVVGERFVSVNKALVRLQWMPLCGDWGRAGCCLVPCLGMALPSLCFGNTWLAEPCTFNPSNKRERLCLILNTELCCLFSSLWISFARKPWDFYTYYLMSLSSVRKASNCWASSGFMGKTKS